MVIFFVNGNSSRRTRESTFFPTILWALREVCADKFPLFFLSPIDTTDHVKDAKNFILRHSKLDNFFFLLFPFQLRTKIACTRTDRDLNRKKDYRKSVPKDIRSTVLQLGNFLLPFRYQFFFPVRKLKYQI